MLIGGISNSVSSTLDHASSQRPSDTTSPSSDAQPASTTAAQSISQSKTASAGGAKVAVSYRTTVAGKNYGETVEESAGRYTASVPMPPGVCASGSTIQAAENNLNTILDTLA